MEDIGWKVEGKGALGIVRDDIFLGGIGKLTFCENACEDWK